MVALTGSSRMTWLRHCLLTWFIIKTREREEERRGEGWVKMMCSMGRERMIWLRHCLLTWFIIKTRGGGERDG